MRWLPLLGFVAVAFVVVDSVWARPRPGLNGYGLAVLFALVCFAAGTAGVIRAGAMSGRTLMPFFALQILGSATLVGLQPGGPGFVGIFVAVTVAALRVRGRGGAAVAVLAFMALAAGGAFSAQSSLLTVAREELGGIAFYVFALLADQLREEQKQAERLLAELEATRDAQARAAALAERARLAREMHDVLAHSLSGLALQLAGARLLASQRGSEREIVDALERAHQLARAGIEEARRAIGMLREDALPGPEQLGVLARELEQDTGVPCLLEAEGEVHDLSPEARLTLYRVVQEALTNVRKHANAERVEIRLGYEPGGTCLTIEDFARPGSSSPPEDGRGYGLTGMRERAELLGGRLVAGPTGSGFRVELWVPA